MAALPYRPDSAAYYEQPSSSGGRMAKEKGAAKGREGEGRPATPPRTSDDDDDADAAVSPSLSRSTLVGPIEK